MQIAEKKLHDFTLALISGHTHQKFSPTTPHHTTKLTNSQTQLPTQLNYQLTTLT